MSLLDFSPRIPLGTFSILLPQPISKPVSNEGTKPKYDEPKGPLAGKGSFVSKSERRSYSTDYVNCRPLKENKRKEKRKHKRDEQDEQREEKTQYRKARRNCKTKLQDEIYIPSCNSRFSVSLFSF